MLTLKILYGFCGFSVDINIGIHHGVGQYYDYIVILKCHHNQYRREIFSIVISAI